ncbi:MAG: hypothetical protein FWG97_00380 [Deltaproteobacteria bacterium]|nr:hypothetical protein [Deltaproteobacteria bacterium]
MKTNLLILTLAVAFMFTSGCATHPNTATGAAVGGATGAGLGAIISSATGGSGWGGALIGGIAGAVIGSIAGNVVDQESGQAPRTEINPAKEELPGFAGGYIAADSDKPAKK